MLRISARYFRNAEAPVASTLQPPLTPPQPTLANSYYIDLRKYMNTSVKNQGLFCNNGYAYATADLMDMLLFGKKSGPLSAQHLTDCSS